MKIASYSKKKKKKQEDAQQYSNYIWDNSLTESQTPVTTQNNQ